MTTLHPVHTLITNIEKWFTGKALDLIQDEIRPLLVEAYDQGFWPKGASRKVVAALNKQTIAAKFARKNERDWNANREDDSLLEGLLSDVGDDRIHHYSSKIRAYPLLHAMLYGQVSQAILLRDLPAKLREFTRNEAETAALETAATWVQDFLPVARLIEQLDATRPIPTYVFTTLSPTVVKNVGVEMGIELTTFRFPEITVTWVEQVITVDGRERTIRRPVARILWPEGTRHNVSRFSSGSRAGHEQCHACGHAIKNPFNWAPLVAETGAGPVSLWVGRDCAQKFFGVKASTDDIEYLDRLRA